MGDADRSHATGAIECCAGRIAAGLIDQKLHERAGIEIKAQRRPSET
jgi:hypothetical protein